MFAESVLVIDDEPDMRLALRHALEKNGYMVACAQGGREALRKLNQETFHLVITDLKMPEMSGIQVLGNIKERSPHLPVIIMTAFGSVHNAVAAMKAGASDYLLKPFSIDTLSNTVTKVLRETHQARRQAAGDPLPPLSKEKTMIAGNAAMTTLLETARKIAASSATVLILGENGTGKELLAGYIHRHSPRKNRPLVAINCAALQETLAESELFGHEKGSFTGAFARKTGKFEQADKGTLLLDEVSELALNLQAKILRVIQEREIDRVGGQQPVPIDVRLIAISNRDLVAATVKKEFREDLLYRLNVIPLTLPPLRARVDDIPALTEYFLQKYSLINNRGMVRIAPESMARLQSHRWGGNVRELENVVERAVLIGCGDTLLPEHLNLHDPMSRPLSVGALKPGQTIKELEMKLILDTLKAFGDNRTQAAKSLGISLRTLRNRLREYRSGGCAAERLSA